MICQKIPHPTHAVARYFRLRTMRVGEAPKSPIEVYHCNQCHGWHIGHRRLRELKTEPYVRPRSNWRTWEIDE
jgi:hypothetical protein